MNHNTEQMTAWPDDTAFNIQWGCPTTQAADSSPCSTSSSPMDDKSNPSECDYAKCVAAQNNMEVEVSLTLPPSNTLTYNFLLPSSQTLCVSNEEALNLTPNGYTNTSTEPSPSMVILYSTDGDQKVWSWNKGESKVREAKSPNCFTIVH